MTARLAAAALAIALAKAAPAAAQDAGPPGPGWTRLQDGSWVYGVRPESQRPPIARDLGRVRHHLRRLAEEPGSGCQSEDLRAAVDGAVEVAMAASGAGDVNDNTLAAGLLLDIADAAADHECADDARALYRFVVRVYVGSAYTAHRQRAEIGLADPRTAGR